MSIAQQRAGAVEATPKVWSNPVRFPAAALSRAASVLGRVLLGPGPGSGIRGYGERPDGFPEHELHQIVAGRKDRFDGLM